MWRELLLLGILIENKREAESHEPVLGCYSSRPGSIIQKTWSKQNRDLLPGLMLVVVT